MEKSKRGERQQWKRDFSAPGRQETADPPVEITDFGWWMMWESPRETIPGTDLKVGHYKSNDEPRSPFENVQSCRDGAQRAAPLREQKPERSAITPV